jgi:hypothetical protein
MNTTPSLEEALAIGQRLVAEKVRFDLPDLSNPCGAGKRLLRE